MTPTAAKKAAPVVSSTPASSELMAAAMKACLLAKDAAYNVRDLIATSSGLALLTVAQCERELDQLERDMDKKIPKAITLVGERTARELIACLRFITDLERICDLLRWAAERPALRELAKEDKAALKEMLSVLEEMLRQVHDGLATRDASLATDVLKKDRELDRIRTDVFKRYVQSTRRLPLQRSIEALFIVQAIERAGDHTTNLAEELVHLVEHRSIRHIKKRMQE